MLKIANGMLESSLSQKAVAEALNTSKCVINCGDITKPGRPKATRPIHDRYLKLCALRNCNITVTELVIRIYDTHDVLISDRTMRNRHYVDGLNA